MIQHTGKTSEAWTLAAATANRYGRLALTCAAGRAAAAQNRGNREESALWSSVVVTLRQQLSTATLTL